MGAVSEHGNGPHTRLEGVAVVLDPWGIASPLGSSSLVGAGRETAYTRGWSTSSGIESALIAVTDDSS